MNLRNKFIISTFGLLSRGKGIEYVIQAMPSILEKEPNAIYLIIGETHPEVRKKEGEQYRNELITLKNELELHNHVKFHNRFLTKRELVKYLQLTDVYVTPYNSPNQISSGTLVYAVGAGKPVVSTPYLHALDVLGNGRGLFCKFKNPESIANNVIKLMDDSLREEIRKRAFKYSRKFLWQNVAKSYADLFREVMR
ncbi:MAG: glycosyltransferase [Candidatus Bathyarchaeota archaeon]